jgi:NAD(P)-dependent dehydrogenase (short-subunit alcohol dehydrogenase family)
MQTSNVIWITGGGSGIGKAAAVAMARRGTHIAVSGRRPAELEAAVAAVHAAGGSAEAHALDVSDADAVASVADAILSRHGHVDILVNSAGTNVPKRAWNSITMSDFRHVVDVNLNGAFNCICTVLPGMRTKGQGTIINVSSWAGFYLTRLTGPAWQPKSSRRAPRSLPRRTWRGCCRPTIWQRPSNLSATCRRQQRSIRSSSRLRGTGCTLASRSSVFSWQPYRRLRGRTGPVLKSRASRGQNEATLAVISITARVASAVRITADCAWVADL